MQQRENDRHDESGQRQETGEDETLDTGEADRPSTEEEIKPGINQDLGASEASSEPQEEASGTDKE
jgi:hypothetical protein